MTNKPDDLAAIAQIVNNARLDGDSPNQKAITDLQRRQNQLIDIMDYVVRELKENRTQMNKKIEEILKQLEK